MQMSMAKAGRDEAPVEENKKEGDGPIEAHKGGNNVPSPHADQGEVLDVDPSAGVVEEPSEATQDDPQSSGWVLPKGL